MTLICFILFSSKENFLQFNKKKKKHNYYKNNFQNGQIFSNVCGHISVTLFYSAFFHCMLHLL